MSTIHDLDLNLLRVLDALLETRSATRAAARLGVGQSAVSHALARLRVALGDPLLVKAGRGLVPTPRAEVMAEPVRQALGALAAALRPERFDPAHARATFMIGSPDYSGVVVWPRVVAAVVRGAPGVELVAVQPPVDPWTALAEGALDLAIGTAGRDVDGLYQQRLFDDGFSTLLRAGHPAAEAPWDLDTYCALRHVMVAPRGTPGSVVDSILHDLGRRRFVQARVAQFVPAAHIVAGSDAVATMPSRLAALLAPPLGLLQRPPPFPVPRFTIWQQWHHRRHADPGHAWLRGLVAEAAAAMTERAPSPYDHRGKV
jgi:DNA-binding transcriptional LysR family regulator